MLFIVSAWTPLHLIAAEDFNNSYWVDCGTNEYREGSDFQYNLDRVLESLVGSVFMTGFNTSVEGQYSSSAAYGLLQCRGDLNSSDCQQCASGTKTFLVDKCHNTSGFVLLNDCFLRYDNHNFYNDYNETSEVMNLVCDSNKSWIPEVFGNTTEKVLLTTIEKAVQNPQHFATDKVSTGSSDSQEIYILAQCWRDLTPTNCRSCLDAGRSKISGAGRSNNSATACATVANGARYRSRNCDLHYEIYSFFNTSIISPSSPGYSGSVKILFGK